MWPYVIAWLVLGILIQTPVSVITGLYLVFKSKNAKAAWWQLPMWVLRVLLWPIFLGIDMGTQGMAIIVLADIDPALDRLDSIADSIEKRARELEDR